MPSDLSTICRDQIPGYDPTAGADGYRFDVDLARRAVEFFPLHLCHIEGKLAGEPFELEPWQVAVIGNLFGWVDKDGFRRYREMLLYVPRKNGKSPMCAGIGAYVFFADRESGQQDYLAAADREQAGMLFRHVKGMIENNPAMLERCRIYGGRAEAGQSRSCVKPDGSFLRVVSADASTKHGGNSHLILVDELHAQPNRELVDVLQTSMASANRPQPLAIWITTADYMRPSICNDKYEYACGVRDGQIQDPRFLPVIYESLPEDDWTSPETWAKANPNLGVSVSTEYMEREVAKAQHDPAYEMTFRRLHLNQRTQAAVKWLPMERWDKCDELAADIWTRPCFGGLDLSSTEDLTAFALLWPEHEEDENGVPQLVAVDCIVRFWVPRETATTRARRDGVPYQAWLRQGHIEETEGDWIDYERIKRAIVEASEQYNLVKIGCDKWNAVPMIQSLTTEHGIECEIVSQAIASLSVGSKRLIDLLKRGKFRHDRNPVLRWNAGNAIADQDAAGNVKPSKRKSAEKVDGITAVVNGLTVLDTTGRVGETSLYVF